MSETRPFPEIPPGLKLVLHVGDGKTGTSSIQETLCAQPENLRRHGFRYLGLMLELAPAIRYHWQHAGRAEALLRLDRSLATQQLLDVLHDAIASARADGIHTLLWSNEAFFGRTENIEDCLEVLQSAGIELSLVAYVRRHDAWLRSAYSQWGIRHKTYQGPLKPFREWCGMRAKRFVPALIRLEKRFPGCLRVRNMDAVGDTLADFIGLVGLSDCRLTMRRYNEAPVGAELVMRAALNNLFEGHVTPRRFTELLGRGLTFNMTAAERLQTLLPRLNDLSEARDQSNADREALDQILAAHDQPPIMLGELPPKPVEVNESALLLTLCDIVVRQAVRIEALEKQMPSLLTGAPPPPGPDGRSGDA